MTTNNQAIQGTTEMNIIEMPAAGQNNVVTLTEGAQASLNSTVADIQTMSVTPEGALVLTFAQGQTLTIENFQEASANPQTQNILLNDGNTIDLASIAQENATMTVAAVDDAQMLEPTADTDFANLIAKPAEANGATTYEMQADAKYVANFDANDVRTVERLNNGDLIITFKDGSQTTLHVVAGSNVQDIPEMTLADGTVINVNEMLEASFVQYLDEDAVVSQDLIDETMEIAMIEPLSGDIASQLAAIEPAAGDAGAAAGPLSGSNNFGSSVLPIGLDPALAIGPIAPTALAFDIPEVNSRPVFDLDFVEEPAPNLSVVQPARGYEDTGINFGVTASPSVEGQFITVTVSGIPAGWTPDNTDATTARGTYDAATGSWTITLAPNESLPASPVFTPPLNSDADIDVVTAVVNQFDPAFGNTGTGTTTGTFPVLVDAVADEVNLTANDVTGKEDIATPLDIATSLRDVDGSEEIQSIVISGLPDGFSLNQGVELSQGTWAVTLAELNGLTLSTPVDYSGTVQLGVTVVNAEVNFSDNEFDLTNNVNQTTTDFTVTIVPQDLPPTVTFGGADGAGEGSARVYEDGTVFAPITANLNGVTPQQLTVTVTGIDSSWTVVTGANNGTYNAATGTWTITMPAGQDYTGGLTFTPPADSDVDMSDLEITATATNTDTNEQLSSSTDGEVIVDAVADQPDLDAGADQTVEAGESIDLNITTGLNDTDGSEVLGNVTISGLPNGYSLNKGTEVSAGVWEVARNDLNGLQLNTPLNGQGNIELTVSVTTTEQITDEDFDLTNNEATTTDTIVVKVNPDDKPILADDDKVSVDESDLNPTDTGSSTITANFGNDTPGTYTVTGENTFSFTGADNGQLTSNGVPVVVTVEGNGYVGTAGGEEIFRLELNENTGNYDFTLSGPLDHADATDPDDVIELSFGVTAEDSDGDQDTGFIRVDVKDDAPVAKDDCNEFTIEESGKDYNIALVMDISSSMSGNKIELLRASVANLVNDLGGYNGGEIKVRMIPFDANVTNDQTFAISTPEGLQAALNYINALETGFGTNYEIGLQSAIEWINNGDSLSGAETMTYFVSDGQPTRYVDGNGNVVSGNRETSIAQITGADGSNEVEMLKAISKVVGVGISVDTQTLANMDIIDSEGNALDVQNPSDLEAALQSANPVGKVVTGNVITGENSVIPGADNLSEDESNTVTQVSFEGNTVNVDPTNGATINGDHGRLQIFADGSYAYTVTDRNLSGNILEKFDYVLTDGDGDTSTATLKLKGEFIADDKPVLADDDKVSVDESDLNPTDTGSSTITANFGNDTPGTYTVTGEDTFSFTGADNGQLTSNGVPVVVTVDGNGYVGTAGDEEIFRLELNENTGNYDFTLSGPLDHADATNPDDVIELTFGVTAQDSDGDQDTGFIRVDVKDDAPVARDDVNASECEITQIVKDYNVAMILDISGSMEGERLALLKSSVSNLLNDFGNYRNGQIKVHLTPFNTVAGESKVFMVSNANELDAALDYIDSLVAVGGTNYEAPMQQAIDWLQGKGSNDPIDGAETYTYFVSDGNPTRYQNDKGESILVGEANADVVMREISGSDGTNEINTLKGLSKEVIGVGIGLSPDALARLDQIDSDGDALDVQDPKDLDAAFQSTNPIISGRAEGNVITGENGGDNAADDLSKDTTNTVTSITFEGTTVAVDPVDGATINGNNGTLTMQADGSYTYVVKSRNNDGGFSEKFTYVLTDSDGDSSSANLTVSCDPKIIDLPPEVTFGGADGAAEGSARVYEDGTVFVPITATLMGITSQQLTVTLTGIDASWTVQTGANNGTYNAATGTWSITLPAGQDYNGGLTLTPPADSDIDLSGLEVTATAVNTTTGDEASNATDGIVIVDAVADRPDLDAGADKTVKGGQSIALDISTALNDTDGSETLGSIRISGIPNGYTLNKGSQVSNNVWEVARNDLNGLKLNTPANASGKFDLTVSVTATEQVSDGEFNLNNNTATATDKVTVTVNANDVPVIGKVDSPLSLEEKLATPNVINGKITADFGQDGNGSSFGVPGNGKFTANGAVGGSTLTSGGVKVNVTIEGDSYIGRAGGKVVFQLNVNEDGTYRFVQNGFLDHKSATNPNEIINLNFDVFAKDGDGDLDVATLTVRVQDTGPVAHDDKVILYSCDYATVGNVITNRNQFFDGGQDRLSVEGPNKIQSVTFEGKTYAMPEDGGEAIMVNGKNGSLYMFDNGSYTYVSSLEEPTGGFTDTFTYTLVDGDGDTSSAELNVFIIESNVTENDAAEYAPFRNETNTTFEGKAAWQTSSDDGAMIIGGRDANVMLGGDGDDALFGWLGNDILVGGNGNDVLHGEQGNNTLIGGNGADVFAIHPDKAFNSNFDTIRDFTPDEGDVLDLHDIITGFDAANDDIADFVRIVNTDGGKMVQVNTDGQGNDFANAAKIQNHADLDLNMLDVYDMYAKGHLDVA